jgi:iron complex transport system substrate-binding protein
MVYALGLEDALVGVTHECDWPADAATKQIVSFSALPAGADPAQVDQLVSESISGGQPIYRLDEESIRRLRPDIVLAQDLCAVCAVPFGAVQQALDVLDCQAEVISLYPSSLDDVIECIVTLGSKTGVEARAMELAYVLRVRLGAVSDAVGGAERPRTFALEWSDPPFNAGHWVPDMIVAAGGDSVLGCAGQPSIRVTWDEIAASEPDAVVFMPCGYDLQHAAEEAAALLGRWELNSARSIFAVDATSYFSRPGPRLVDGVEILAAALHPERVAPAPPGSLARLR